MDNLFHFFLYDKKNYLHLQNDTIGKNIPNFDIPIIFLTGVSEKETVLKTLVELKPQGYVLKPTRKSELVAKIIDVIDKTAADESM